MRRADFTYRRHPRGKLIFHRRHAGTIPIPGGWAIHIKNPRNLVRIIRAENHNTGNRASADDIGLSFNIAGVARHNVYRYRGKPLEERQVRLARAMGVKMRRR